MNELNRSSEPHGHQRTMSMKSTRRPATSGEALAPGMPKPLLDFTPQFKEAPQWDKSKKGKGVKGVDGPLVEAATTYEAAQVMREFMPEKTVFRRENGRGMVRPKTSAAAGGGPLVNGAGNVGGKEGMMGRGRYD